MEEMDLISKKELLQMTGISYGQLYRWKRENLIPEAWFVKKSSFTGQETFFPKDKILKRTSMILELKDKYSLEDLARLLTPESSSRLYRKADMEEIKGIDLGIADEFISVFNKDKFNFIELTFIYIISKLKEEKIISRKEISDAILSINSWSSFVKDTSYVLLVLRNEAEAFTMLLKQEAVYFLDFKTKKLKMYYLDEAAKELNEFKEEIL